MRVTNRYGLPSALVKAVEGDRHTSADFSVTQLLKGSTEIALEMMFAEQLEMDVSDMVNMVLGTAVHKVLEEQDTEGVLNEHHMQAVIYAGLSVSGTADAVDTITKRIVDYKTCSSWKVIYKDYDDWREQLKGYLYLWFLESGEVWHDAEIVALVKDFSPTDRMRVDGYPKSPIVSVRFEYTDAEIFGVCERWTEKISDVLKKLGTQEWGMCSESERWAKPAKWALMKEGRKSAVKLYDTEKDAADAKGDDPKLYVEYRAGKDVKCDDYCVAGKCGLCPYRNSKEDING